MAEIVLTQRALRDLEKLEASLRKRIGEKLQAVADNPLAYARKLSHAKIGTYRIRVGDYRIIFDWEDQRMLVLRIGHRRDIYQ